MLRSRIAGTARVARTAALRSRTVACTHSIACACPAHANAARRALTTVTISQAYALKSGSSISHATALFYKSTIAAPARGFASGKCQSSQSSLSLPLSLAAAHLQVVHSF